MQRSKAAAGRRTGLASDCRETLLRRLAQGFSAAGWARDGGWGALALSGLLGGLDEAEAELLLHLGLIEEEPGRPFQGPKRASDKAVLTFLERYGAWWFQLRLEKQICAIRRRIARMQSIADVCENRSSSGPARH